MLLIRTTISFLNTTTEPGSNDGQNMDTILIVSKDRLGSGKGLEYCF